MKDKLPEISKENKNSYRELNGSAGKSRQFSGPWWKAMSAPTF